MNKSMVGQYTQEKIIEDLDKAKEIYKNFEDKLLNAARTLSEKEDLKRNILTSADISQLIQFPRHQSSLISTIIITDYSGKVIARNRNPDRKAESLTSDPFVARAIEGKELFGTVIVLEDELSRDKLDCDARIEIISTEGTKPTNETAVTSGMMIKASCPIRSGDEIIGSVVLGHLINNNFLVVDTISTELPIATSTIFMKDIRISTNVTIYGNRAVGTLVSDPIYKKVLVGKERYIGRAFVVNGWYITAYDPIYDIEQEIIGMLYVGTPELINDLYLFLNIDSNLLKDIFTNLKLDSSKGIKEQIKDLSDKVSYDFNKLEIIFIFGHRLFTNIQEKIITIEDINNDFRILKLTTGDLEKIKKYYKDFGKDYAIKINRLKYERIQSNSISPRLIKINYDLNIRAIEDKLQENSNIIDKIPIARIDLEIENLSDEKENNKLTFNATIDDLERIVNKLAEIKNKLMNFSKL